MSPDPERGDGAGDRVSDNSSDRATPAPREPATDGNDGSAASSASSTDDPRTFDDKRRDQLTSAPAAVESDADPRIDVSKTDDGTTRIDWRPEAPIKP